MVSYSNKFVLIRTEGGVSVGKQLVLRTASTYQRLVKAPSWLHLACLHGTFHCGLIVAFIFCVTLTSVAFV